MLALSLLGKARAEEEELEPEPWSLGARLTLGVRGGCLHVCWV